MQKPMTSRALGSAFALAASVLIAAQAPLSSPAAQQLSVFQFIFLTQIALLVSVPLLLISADGRRGLVGALGSMANYWKLAAIFAVSAAGLVLYNVSLSHAHPVVVVAILNLGALLGRARCAAPEPDADSGLAIRILPLRGRGLSWRNGGGLEPDERRFRSRR